MLRSKHPSDTAFEAWVDDADGGAVDILRTHVVQAGFRGGWNAAVDNVKADLTVEIDRLRGALQQIVWLADATEPLSVKAAEIARQALED